MAGRRTDDPTVTTWTARRLGVQTQADREADRRFGDRVGAYGEDPRNTASPADNFDDWTNTGNVDLNLDEDGQRVRIGPTLDKADPLATVNGNAFVLSRDASGNVTLHGEGNSSSFAWFDLSDTGGFVGRQGSITLEDILGASRITLVGNTGTITADSFVGTATPIVSPGQWLSGFHSDPGANTLSTYGMPAPTVSGTLANFTVTEGPGLTFTTGAVSGDDAQIITTVFWESRWGIDATFRVRTSAITDVRLWAGLFASDPSAINTPAVEHVGFRFSTSAPDTNWRTHSSDAANSNSNDSGVAVAANTTYELRIVTTDGTSFGFYIDGDLVDTITTRLPVNTTDLFAYLSASTLTAATKAFRVHHVKVVSR